MFADRLSSKDGLRGRPEDATTNREQLVLSLMKRAPLLEYSIVVVLQEQQTETEGVGGQQNKLQVLDSKGSSCGDDSKSKIKTVEIETVDEVATFEVVETVKEAVVETVEVAETVKVVVETVEVVETVKEVVETVKEVFETVKVEASKVATVKVGTVEVQTIEEEGGTIKKDWSQLKVPALKEVLRVRNLKLSGRKADLVLRLIASDLEIHESENRFKAKPTSLLTSVELLELQKIDELLHEIDECILNLKPSTIVAMARGRDLFFRSCLFVCTKTRPSLTRD
jgi:hypothetical protein